MRYKIVVNKHNPFRRHKVYDNNGKLCFKTTCLLESFMSLKNEYDYVVFKLNGNEWNRTIWKDNEIVGTVKEVKQPGPNKFVCASDYHGKYEITTENKMDIFMHHNDQLVAQAKWEKYTTKDFYVDIKEGCQQDFILAVFICRQLID